jgi:hypothetical protein
MARKRPAGTGYAPNYKDPRIIARFKHAISYVLTHVDRHIARSLYTRDIDLHFGSSANDTAQYLRKILLIVVCDFYSKDAHICKKYVRNQQGLRFIHGIVDKRHSFSWDDYKLEEMRNPNLVELGDAILDSIRSIDDNLLQKVTDKVLTRRTYADVLHRVFVYTDLSDRLWNSLQFVRRDVKKVILANAGFVYQYDVQCSAPTLLLQHARKLGYTGDAEFIEFYLENRTDVRIDLAAIANVSVAKIKTFINATFCGAKIGLDARLSLANLFELDANVINTLKDDVFVQALKKQVSLMWKFLADNGAVIRHIQMQDDGEFEMSRITSADRWALYFMLERKVLDAVRKYLEQTNNIYFLEHDGWSTINLVNVVELTEFIYHETGMRVKIDLEVLVPTYTRKAPKKEALPSSTRTECCIIIPTETRSTVTQDEAGSTIDLDKDLFDDLITMIEDDDGLIV